jgi:hypothetical protein
MGARSHLINYGARAGTRYASRASRYLRQGIGGVNLEKVLTLAAIGGALYLGWKLYKAISAVGNFAGEAGKVGKAVTDAIGGALGRGLYSLFNRNDPEYSGVSGYIVFFPDQGGVFKYISKEAVSKDGFFQLGGRYYDLVKLKPEARYTVPHPVSGKPWTVALVAKPA